MKKYTLLTHIDHTHYLLQFNDTKGIRLLSLNFNREEFITQISKAHFGGSELDYDIVMEYCSFDSFNELLENYPELFI